MPVNNKVPKLKLLIVVDEDKQRDPRSGQKQFSLPRPAPVPLPLKRQQPTGMYGRMTYKDGPDLAFEDKDISSGAKT
jgi:hypothetical protein